MTMVSVLHPFAYGQVSEDNADQDRTIKVKVLEHLPSQYGIPNADITTDEVDIEHFLDKTSSDGKGKQEFTQRIKHVEVDFKDWVPANWLNRTANRISSPMVVTGQRVLLWRVGDSNQYYWEELDVDMRLKPEEHIIIAINNHNKNNSLSIDNAYIIELSTKTQRMRVRTNRNNGEKAAFEFDVNGGSGYLKVMDDCAGDKHDYRGNGFLIDSVNTMVAMQNVDGSSYILNKTNIEEVCTGDKTTTVGGSVNINASATNINSTLNVSDAATFKDTVEFEDDVHGGTATWDDACNHPPCGH